MTKKQDLIKIRSRALRARAWFKVLSKVERAIINLTIECVKKVRSKVLTGAISEIVNKILGFLQEGFMKEAEKTGYVIAEKLCALGERWGNKTCSTWKCDKGFISFLGVNALNA